MKVDGAFALLSLAACQLAAACEGGSGVGVLDAGSQEASLPRDSGAADAARDAEQESTDVRVIECQPGSQQACRGDDACWGHRSCNDQYKLGDCICETAAGGAGSDAHAD